METTSRALARKLYKVYTDSSGGLNYQGKPCPMFDDLPPAIQGHWEAVAIATMPPPEERAPDPSYAKYSPDVKRINEVVQAFTYHPVTGDQDLRYAMLRDKFQQLAFLLLEQTPGGRAQSLAFTNLEQAAMWANKSIALES